MGYFGSSIRGGAALVAAAEFGQRIDVVSRGKRNMTFSVLCQICDGLSCDIATVTKGIPHLQTVGGLASGSRVLDSDRERAEGKFQKPGKMGSQKEREIV